MGMRDPINPLVLSQIKMRDVLNRKAVLALRYARANKPLGVLSIVNTTRMRERINPYRLSHLNPKII